MKGKFPVNRARRGGRTSCPASRSKAVGLTTRKHPRFFPVMPRNERVASGQFRRFHRSGTGTIEGGLVSGGEHAQPDLLEPSHKTAFPPRWSSVHADGELSEGDLATEQIEQVKRFDAIGAIARGVLASESRLLGHHRT